MQDAKYWLCSTLSKYSQCACVGEAKTPDTHLCYLDSNANIGGTVDTRNQHNCIPVRWSWSRLYRRRKEHEKKSDTPVIIAVTGIMYSFAHNARHSQSGRYFWNLWGWFNMVIQ